MRGKLVGVAAAAALCSLVAAGCGAGGKSAASATPGSSLALGSAVSVNGTIGAGCDTLPASGPDSLTALARDPIATAVAHTKLLSELALAIRAAGLTGRLNSARAVTLLAPDDAAFTGLGRGNVKTLLADKPDMRTVLDYHMITGRVTPAELNAGAPINTLLGVAVHPARTTLGYELNSAQVLCGNIQVANGIVYIIGSVLVP
jgi:uncharacterized surface protein with fasciclin (FAS1) repeats